MTKPQIESWVIRTLTEHGNVALSNTIVKTYGKDRLAKELSRLCKFPVTICEHSNYDVKTSFRGKADMRGRKKTATYTAERTKR